MPIRMSMTDLKRTAEEPIDDLTASVNELMADTSAAAGEAASAVRTFRGRSLEELIPRIRAELGADAVVVRSRECLSGGVAGFFQRQHVEVEARAPLAHERHDGELARNDRATSEGLATPGVQALIDGAQPFSAELAHATGRAAGITRRPTAFVADPLPVAPGLYGPQPNLEAMRSAAAALPAAFFTPSEALLEVSAPPAPVVAEAPAEAPLAPEAPLPPEAEAAAPADPSAGAASARIRDRLGEAGLTPDLAADVVGEAVDHLLPFAAGRPLEQHVRAALARRIPVLGDIGPGRRTLAFVGAGGSGKTAATANLAVAYAAADRRVAVIALGDGAAARDLVARLEPLGLFVHVAGTGAEARELISRLRPLLALVDVSESADPAEAEAVRSDLSELRADEVHLALPATLSGAAAVEAHARQRPLGVTHLCLTHADATAHPGAPVGLAIDRGLPISFSCTRGTIAPADSGELASRLLP